MRNIFHNERDHYKWSKQKEYINQADNIDDYTRDKALIALTFLEQEFGAQFLKSHSINHPIRQMISDKTEFQIKDLIEFTETLRILKTTDSNYQKLIKKLLSEKVSKTEGVPFVEIARMYIKEKMSISFIDEDKKNGNKTPDVQVINPDNGDIFFIEITKLDNSNERKKISDNYHFFHKEFNDVQPLFSFYGEQKEIINTDEYPKIKEIIANAKNKVRENSQIIYYSDHRFSFLLVPPNHNKNFNEICEQNSIRPIHFNGLPQSFDDTNRINNKISKAKQIPENQNGLLYVSISPLYFMTTDLPISIERIVANIAKHKNLLGIVLFSTIVDSREEVAIKSGNHLFARRTIQNLCYESLFIYNNNCDVILSDETIQKIYKTLS